MSTKEHPDVRRQSAQMLAAANTAYIQSMMKDFFGAGFSVADLEIMFESLAEASVRVTAHLPEQKALLKTFALEVLDKVEE
jgi:hypothetical protein